MEHILLSVVQFLLLLGAVGIFLVMALVLGVGLAAKAVARMFYGGRQQKRAQSDVEMLRQRLFEAQTTAYEAAVASEKTIQELQRRLHVLEAERGPSCVSVHR